MTSGDRAAFVSLYREHFGEVVLRTSIPRSVRVSEAPVKKLNTAAWRPRVEDSACSPVMRSSTGARRLRIAVHWVR